MFHGKGGQNVGRDVSQLGESVNEKRQTVEYSLSPFILFGLCIEENHFLRDMSFQTFGINEDFESKLFFGNNNILHHITREIWVLSWVTASNTIDNVHAADYLSKDSVIAI
jgi:hypothetical protein